MYIYSAVQSPHINVVFLNCTFISNTAVNMSNGIQCTPGSKCGPNSIDADSGTTSGGGSVYLSLYGPASVEVLSYLSQRILYVLYVRSLKEYGTASGVNLFV